MFFNISKISSKLNLFDYPDGKRKIHKKKTPLLGGIFIFINLLFLFFFYDFEFFVNFKQLLIDKNKIIFLFSFVSIFLIGIYDDKYNSSPTKRILLFILISYILLSNNPKIIIDYLKFESFDYSIKFKSLSLIFTIFCFIVAMIFMNMYDGVNGQSAIFYIFASIYLFFNNNYNFLILFSISLIFFLFFNLKSKIFLGSSGSNILSFFFSYLIIVLYSYENFLTVEKIFLIFFIPFLDSVRVIFNRLISGRGIMVPDKSHFHHIFLQKYGYRNLLIFNIFFYLLVLILLFQNVKFIIFGLASFMIAYFIFLICNKK